jgi:uroporphyrin-III C-methyltransferase
VRDPYDDEEGLGVARYYLVGAGPGRADLLTLRAARVLGEADVVIYDRLVSEEVLAMCRAGAERVYAGKEEGEQEEGQERIYRLFRQHAMPGRRVVRLKSGDPFVFGRGAEEWAWLQDQGFGVEVVPGVSSALAVPALAGVPPTFRGMASGFAVVTGNAAEGGMDWGRYAGVDTVVVLMGVKQRGAIAAGLMGAGRNGSDPVVVVERGTTAEERVVATTLAGLGEAEVAAPAVMVIGKVAGLRDRLVVERSAVA